MTASENKYSVWTGWMLLLLILKIMTGCDSSDGIGEDPYAGGKAPLGIKLRNVTPIPETAAPEDTVIFGAQGVLAWCDPEAGRYDFEFYLADEKLEILTANDTSITVVIPKSVSSGLTYLKLQGQVFYGPRFEIIGSVTVDDAYELKRASDAIYTYLPRKGNDKYYYLGGAFYSLGGERLYNIGMVDINGLPAKPASEGYNVTVAVPYSYTIEGAGFYLEDTYVKDMNYFEDGKVLVSGMFSAYEIKKNSYFNHLHNIVVVNQDFSLWTVEDSLQLADVAGEKEVTVAGFNGGTLEPIVKSFVTSEQQVIALGNLKTYCRINYEESSAYEKSNVLNAIYDYTKVNSVIRMDVTGKLDEAYRAAKSGANGSVEDAYMDGDDRVVVVGEFTVFDDVPASGIVRLTAEGNVDAEFQRNIGTGANGRIRLVRYSKRWKRTMIVGNFTQFNGKDYPGVVMLNEDGTVDENFVLRTLEGGSVNFAALLDGTGSGVNDIGEAKVVLSGTFQRYEGVSRPGFLMVNYDGEAVQDFNVPGTFSGQLYQVVETLTSRRSNGLLLLGLFNRFNDLSVYNAVMIEVDIN